MFDNLTFEKFAKWSGFMGVWTIIAGVLSALTIVGIPAAIIMIILGVKLLGAKSSAKALAMAPEGDVSMHINKLVGDLKTYFQINGVLIVISLIIMVLAIIAGVIALIALGGEIPDFNFEWGV
jgi:amino acid transporter